MSDQDAGGIATVERLVRLFHDGRSRSNRRDDVGLVFGRQIHEISSVEFLSIDVDRSLEHVEESLHRRRRELSLRIELHCVLGEHRASGRRDVDDRRGFGHSRQWCANECVGRLQEMIRLVGAACVSESVHKRVYERWAAVAALGLTSLPRVSATTRPSVTIVSPRRSVRRTTPRNDFPTYGLIA